MSTSRFKYKCWRPNDQSETEAIEIEADYAQTAAEQFMNFHIVGYEASGEEDGILINTRDPFGHVDEFQVCVTLEPVYSVRRF